MNKIANIPTSTILKGILNKFAAGPMLFPPVLLFSHVLLVVNSSTNMIIYCSLNRTFRAHLVKMVGWVSDRLLHWIDFLVVVGILSIWLRRNMVVMVVDSHTCPILTNNVLPKVIIKIPTTTSFSTQNKPNEEVWWVSQRALIQALPQMNLLWGPDPVSGLISLFWSNAFKIMQMGTLGYNVY